MTLLFRLSLLLAAFGLTNCGIYGFKGISIPSNVDTFLVEDFTISDLNSPPDINQLVAERLRRKIRDESRLTRNENDPQVIFSGSITSYSVTYIAPSEGSTASLNRLEVKIKVDFEDIQNEDNSWSKTYSNFEDYDNNADFESLQDGLIDNILEYIVEQVFNDAFTNW